MGGKPCTRGVRFAVHDVMDDLAGGLSVERLPSDFPHLTPEGVRASVACLADVDRRISRAA